MFISCVVNIYFFLLKYVLDVFIVIIFFFFFFSFKNLLVITSFSKSKKLICIFLICKSDFFKIKNRFVSSLDTNLNFFLNQKQICVFLRYNLDFFNTKIDLYLL